MIEKRWLVQNHRMLQLKRIFFSFKSPNLQIKNIRQREEKFDAEITQLKILDRKYCQLTEPSEDIQYPLIS